jgi:hypothetical protein
VNKVDMLDKLLTALEAFVWAKADWHRRGDWWDRKECDERRALFTKLYEEFIAVNKWTRD